MPPGSRSLAWGDLAPLLEAQSALADIIVLNTALADHEPPDMRATVSEVVVRSGKPILAVPEGARGVDAGGHALIAWNGSSAISRTLLAATPLLTLASGVTIVEFGAPNAALVGSTSRAGRQSLFSEVADYLPSLRLKPISD